MRTSVRAGIFVLLFGAGGIIACGDSRPPFPASDSRTSATLRAYLATHPNEPAPISIFYDFQWPDGLGDLLSDPNEQVRLAAQAQLRLAVQRQGQALRTRLEADRVVVNDVGTAFPALFVHATPAQVNMLETYPGIGRLRLNVPTTGSVADAPLSGPPNSMSAIQIDSKFNALGFYGLYQGIGFTEGGRCGVYDTHQAFASNSPPYADRVVYDGPINTCDAINYPQQCASCSFSGASGAGQDFLCVNGQCVGTHATWVMSSAAASTNAMYGAAQANLYYGNSGTGAGLVACNDQAIINEYTWFTSPGVAATTANESYTCNNDGNPLIEKDSDGPIQDWFSRSYQITIVRASGDGGNDGDSKDHACPFIHNAICVGGYNAATQAVDTASSWANPWLAWNAGGGGFVPGSFTNIPTAVCDYTSSSTGFGKQCGDREEPDVLALSTNVQTAGVDAPQTDQWGAQSGTSQAAPAVAALVALMKQACAGPLGHGSMLEAQARARIRTGAYLLAPQFGYGTVPNEPPACAPGSACDQRAGAGLVNAAALLDFCGYQGTNNTPFSFRGTFTPGRIVVQNTPPVPSGKYGGLPSGQLVHLGALVPNETIRATLAWDICVSNHDKVGESVMDIDLFLYNNTTQQYVTTQPNGRPTFSSTYDDNNEGFQALITQSGDYSFMVGVPQSAVGCLGTTSEPWFLEAVHGVNF